MIPLVLTGTRMGERKYKIFISSVQQELETERVAVAGAVSSDRTLGRHCDIVLFEKEPLSGRKVAKPYLECLAGCDAYILILDREYGGRPSGPLSATYEEYRYAQGRNMPMMIFIRGDHDPERTRETQAFFAEIRRDGHTYRRFHDRMDSYRETRYNTYHQLP